MKGNLISINEKDYDNEILKIINIKKENFRIEIRKKNLDDYLKEKRM